MGYFPVNYLVKFIVLWWDSFSSFLPFYVEYTTVCDFPWESHRWYCAKCVCAFIDMLCCCLPCIDSCNSYTQVNCMDKWTTDWGMVSRKLVLDFMECLKISVCWKFGANTKNHHYGNFFITDGTSGCHYVLPEIGIMITCFSVKEPMLVYFCKVCTTWDVNVW